MKAKNKVYIFTIALYVNPWDAPSPTMASEGLGSQHDTVS